MWKVKRKIKYYISLLLYGGQSREKMLVGLLNSHFINKKIRDWSLTPEMPHFTDLRTYFFLAGYNEKTFGIDQFSRGFYSSEVIKDGDVLLDVGCGDGFYTKRFFSQKCSHIDAVDIEPSAIARASQFHGDPKIEYKLLDATADPFPRNNYDVVIWDGAIGHFDAQTNQAVLLKIKNALKPGGIFAGSESLGTEGHDHLQFFPDLQSLAATLKPHFKYVYVKAKKYTLEGGYMREEAYWRCSDEEKSVTDLNWKTF